MTRTVPEQQQIEQRIVEYVGGEFPWAIPQSPQPPGPGTRLRDDLQLDSLHLVELQVSLEDQFAVAFDPADEGLPDAFDTVGSLAAYVQRLLREGA
jgi:acyl carrier protein